MLVLRREQELGKARAIEGPTGRTYLLATCGCNRAGSRKLAKRGIKKGESWHLKSQRPDTPSFSTRRFAGRY